VSGVSDLDEVTYDLEVDGVEVRRTIHRKVFERRGWATVAIVFQELEPTSQTWKPAKLALIRLQRVHEAWKKHATITLNSDDARALTSSLSSWSSAFASDET